MAAKKRLTNCRRPPSDSVIDTLTPQEGSFSPRSGVVEGRKGHPLLERESFSLKSASTSLHITYNLTKLKMIALPCAMMTQQRRELSLLKPLLIQ